MMKKYFVTAFLSLAFAFATNAQDTKVNVLYLDGTPHVVQMSQVRKLKITGDDVLLLSADGTTVATHKTADIDKIELTADVTAINTPSKVQAVTIRYNGTSITASGMTNGSALTVYATSGAVVAKAKARDGKATINVSDLGAGVYVVKTDGQTLKMVKR
mgnify:FL=1